MRQLCLFLAVLCLVIVTAATPWAETTRSHLGHQGPAFAPGMTPSKLGWGPDEKP